MSNRNNKTLKIKKMKKLILTLGLIAGSIGSGFANPETAKSKNLSELRNQIVKEISFPQELKKENFNEKAVIVFSISKDGNIQIEKIETQNLQLKTAIEKMLRDAKFETQSEELKNQLYRIELKFKVA